MHEYKNLNANGFTYTPFLYTYLTQTQQNFYSFTLYFN